MAHPELTLSLQKRLSVSVGLPGGSSLYIPPASLWLFLSGSTFHLHFPLCPHSPNPFLSCKRDSTKTSSGSSESFVCVGAGRTLWCSSAREMSAHTVGLLHAGVSFLVLASCKHPNGEHETLHLNPSPNTAVLPRTPIRSQETTKALGA